MSKLLKNKRILYILSGILITIFFYIFAIKEISTGKKQIEALKEQQKEMLILKNEFLSLKQKIDAIEGKKNLSNVQGIIEAVEEVFPSIGLKDKVKTVKSTARREIRDGIEEEADINIEKVSMNEMVNIFYRMENAPMILTIKKAAIKKSFENPELLNISLTLSFLKSK
ncbi:MAG: hypothetical protein IBX72_11115 [Nitrospirae bacterium]|nr:hypothetical protein [Nitrospirota bacterium]